MSEKGRLGMTSDACAFDTCGEGAWGGDKEPREVRKSAASTGSGQEPKAARNADDARFSSMMERFHKWWTKPNQGKEFDVHEWCHRTEGQGPCPWGVVRGSCPDRRKVQHGLLEVRKAATKEGYGSYPIQKGPFKGMYHQDVHRLCKTFLLTERGGMEGVGAVWVGASGREKDDEEVEEPGAGGTCEQLVEVARKARNEGAEFIGSVGGLYVMEAYRGKTDAVFELLQQAWRALADLGVETVLLSVDDEELKDVYCRLGAQEHGERSNGEGCMTSWVCSVSLPAVRKVMRDNNPGFTLRPSRKRRRQ